MKIREGLVSNSSSSCFIVQIRSTTFDSFCKKDIPTLSDDIVKKLEEIGFVDVEHDSPFYFEIGKRDLQQDILECETEDRGCFMGFSIYCNQDIIMQHLVKNNIPFKASVHYGHEFYFYKQGSDKLVRVPNAGLVLEMASDFEREEKFVLTEIKEIPVEEYLEDYDPEDIKMFLKKGER